MAAYYFETKYPECYTIDDTTKMITLNLGETPPRLFYYHVGDRNKPYTSLKKYGSGKNVPLVYRITPKSILITEVVREISICPAGKIEVDADIEPCIISFYNAELKSKNGFQRYYNVLSGKTKSGHVLDETTCRHILAMPVKTYTESGDVSKYWLEECSLQNRVQGNEASHLAALLEKRYLNEDISIINLKTETQKAKLEKEVSAKKNKVQPLKESFDKGISDSMEELQVKKQLMQLEHEIKKREKTLFLERMRIEAAADKQIDDLKNTDNLKVDMYRVFQVHVWGKNGPDPAYLEENESGQKSFL